VDSRITPASERGPLHDTGRLTPSMLSTLRYRVFGSLCRASPDDLPSRLGLEHCWLLRERIDAFARHCGGLLDHNELGESGHNVVMNGLTEQAPDVL
jgi:hypothetical protein